MAQGVEGLALSQISVERASFAIEALIRYAVHHEMMAPLDMPYVRNQLLELFHISEPCSAYREEQWEAIPEEPHHILEELLDCAYESGLIPDRTVTQRDLLDARIMGMLMPRPAELQNRFQRVQEAEGIERATADFYRINQKCNYIRTDRVRNNEYWLHRSEFGEMEMTINLSKPEKSPQEIALAAQLTASHYPECLLCADNVGYAGRLDHPARQNLRILPIKLNGEDWYFQYSPYVYYNEHSIIFHKEHFPMKLTRNTFARLLDFTEQFPHYFIGSNADLPIVGGSILSHDHFQAGKHTFPIERAPIDVQFVHPAYPGITAGIVRWPMSVLRLQSEQPDVLLQCADELYEQWKGYSDESVGVAAITNHGDKSIRHNTITPIVRRRGSLFEMDLVLRNNRTDEAHPEGIFHPHREHHHIKRENIGLIEVMGLAILPGRLKQDIERITMLLSDHGQWEEARSQLQETDSLYPHRAWVDQLLNQYGIMAADKAKQVILHEIGNKFVSILWQAGVFKNNAQGWDAFCRFAAACGYQRVEIPSAM
ncbi:UDP-glucose--hexose-1-phosphate uridylyltransferase [Paenibacillus alvei]|uniref:UDP-glucose--hexose-1-phosphate uridylyltransferase n=1 Tax=Paenibacillus alvei TaxID=44250 RepID=UPI000287FFD8|nr:UDP-glucose--hexose-1-phosphate uridylyltransferase [Paenibacillus alvei]EJW17147.1 galactose-1-phosphate uridylyltransferase GalT [Paenibacillus alvei DSM 29]MCY9541499.1 UDP-glucose--hexose-1-phosphate uridylyltransferase [Paenibacillus alvei]MCY9705283.1 UDP-glucose--hexose-1-phosphate uridylyltransferase [Paenibacillus alvei]MCY9735011.1 UDP-glucose--hexose-1-phosphate uridylyltransferase [Paenibacillus alvei]MCY9754246.1 UDP-glucose--hexose-1-phosphate uridylyltransferase [Paenibacillu